MQGYNHKHNHRLALIDNPKLPYQNVFCGPDNGTINDVGVKDTGDPEDDHEDNKQDHDDPRLTSASTTSQCLTSAGSSFT